MTITSPNDVRDHFANSRHFPGGYVTQIRADRDFVVVVLLALLGITLSAAALNSGITAPDLSDIAAFLG